MTRTQRTLARSTDWVAGHQLDQQLDASVRFHPAPADSGLTFLRSDLPGQPTVACELANLRSQPRWTSLEQGGVWVHHTEHVLASLAGAGVDNAVIEMNSDRLPVVAAGSCAGFVAAVSAAGLVEQDAPRKVYRLTSAVYETMALVTPPGQDAAREVAAPRYVAGMPADVFAVTYVFHVPHLAGLPIGLAEYEATRHGFLDSIGCARTYFLESELAQVSTLLNEAMRDFIQLRSDSPQSLVDEVARHKAMDFLGDLMVLGRPTLGRFFAFRSGHKLHHQLAQSLAASGSLELADA
jgi:UDP-3-O-[3-hydroxymyristoyl] N-acetylglucosamine deacetylase